MAAPLPTEDGDGLQGLKVLGLLRCRCGSEEPDIWYDDRRLFRDDIASASLQDCTVAEAEEAAVALIDAEPIKHKIIWVPGHTGVAGNQEADRIARGYVSLPIPQEYSAILNNYKGSRMRYPPPHKSLNKEEAVTWRQLQTGSYPNLNTPSIPTVFYPAIRAASNTYGEN
ncbi:uncharacterized protein LOC144108340 [Amblyomma americanum]